MAYHSFRIINYQVGTTAQSSKTDHIGNPLLEYAIDPGRVSSPPTLYGDDKLSNDLRVRLQRILKVLQVSYQRFKDNDDAHTLKVFLAPEFYFRPKNNLFACSQDEYKALKTAFIESLCRLDIGQNWLIYPGTIVWYDQRKSIANALVKQTVRDKVKKDSKVFFNTCLTLQKRGGVYAQEREKIYLSINDGMPSIEYKERHGQSGATAAEAFVQFSKHVQTPLRITSMGAINVGLEICIEHRHDIRLLKSYLRGQDPSQFPDKLHLHLLIAAGMSTSPQSIAAKVNGHFVRCDGSYHEIDGQCDFLKINQYGQQTPSGKSNADTTVIDFDQTIDLDADYPDLGLKPPQNCEANWPASAIHISASIRV